MENDETCPPNTVTYNTFIQCAMGATKLKEA